MFLQIEGVYKILKKKACFFYWYIKQIFTKKIGFSILIIEEILTNKIYFF